MFLDRVIDFVTDKDMQADGSIRSALLSLLKALDKHLETGYTPTKDVQHLLNELEWRVQEFEESILSVPEPEESEVIEEVLEDDEIDLHENDDDEEEEEILDDDEE